jgi:putative intracellular protease/amidase
VGEALDVAGAPSLHRVEEFVEKPDPGAAARYVEAGWKWNAGMFVVRAATLLQLLDELEPQLAAGLRAIGAAWSTTEREEVLAATWPGSRRCPSTPAVAEPAARAGRVAVVPGGFGWDDVGDWTSLGDLLAQADSGGTPVGEQVDGLLVLGDASLVMGRHASGVVVPASGRTVVVAGLSDVVVVDTLDAVLVTTREQAQGVKHVVDLLKSEAAATWSEPVPTIGRMPTPPTQHPTDAARTATTSRGCRWSRCPRRPTSRPGSRTGSAAPGGTRTPAACTPACTRRGRGPCASTRASAARRSPTPATTSWSRPGRAG